MDEKTKEKIKQLQLIEQNIQGFLAQKHQLQLQLVEIESALKEIENCSKSYKIVGNIMIDKNKDELKKELEQKKETVELRMKTLEEQEKKLKEKANAMQSEVMKVLESDNK